MTSSKSPIPKSDPSPTCDPVSETGSQPHSTYAIHANLDFEYELSHPTNDYKTPPPVLKFIERWRHILRLMPGFENAHALTPTEIPPPSHTFTHLLPWGASPTATSSITTTTNFPDFTAVKHVNDKRFSHALEKRAGIDLPHTRIVATLQELELAAQTCPFDWVAKHPMGVSGRERILGKAHKLDPQSATWATRQFQAGWQLVFEPWVKIDHEYSLQFDISTQGHIQFLGTIELLTDTVGTFRGHRSLQDPTIPNQLAKTAQPLLTELVTAGYHGPVGLDALTGHLGTLPITRPITEINARITFGRLALELAHHVPPTYKYIWWHPSKSAAKAANLQILGPLTPQAHTPGAYHLPTHTDPHARSQTLVLIAPQNTPFPQIF